MSLEWTWTWMIMEMPLDGAIDSAERYDKPQDWTSTNQSARIHIHYANIVAVVSIADDGLKVFIATLQSQMNLIGELVSSQIQRRDWFDTRTEWLWHCRFILIHIWFVAESALFLDRDFMEASDLWSFQNRFLMAGYFGGWR